MSGDKVDSRVLQRQIQNNAEELNDYLRDLKQWEEEIKRKDQLLLKQKQSNDESNSNVLPPIRNDDICAAKTTTCGPSTTKKFLKLTNDDKKTRISSYDYASWDRFDVDEVCKESDSNDSEYDSEAEIMKQKQEAEMEKEKGNRHLKENRLDDAIGCYTKGIALDPHNPLIPANRALAFIKKEQYAAAEEDCSVALRLDPRYPKGYLRRAAARVGLRKYDLAREDLSEVLKLEPNNTQAKQELAKIDKASKKVTENEGTSDSSIVIPIEKPPHLRSKKPLHRIKIVEVLEDDDRQSHETSKDDERAVISCNSATNSGEPSRTMSKPYVPTVNVTNFTSYQFQKDFRRLKRHPELLFEYIKQIPASKYQQLFQHSLESDVMSHLLFVYRDFYLPSGLDIYPFLLNLSRINRFSALRMFFSEDDKNVLSQLFSHLKNKELIPEDLNSLISTYGLQT